MPSSDSEPPPSSRELGPIRTIDTSLGRRLLGSAQTFLGLLLVGWTVYTVGRPTTSAVSVVLYAAAGAFGILYGLRLVGVRLR